MIDFTVTKYRELLLRIQEADIPIYGVRNWMQKKPEFGIFIRHDVDRIPENSLTIARLEAKLGILTTYYFRCVKGSFNPAIIEEIASLGHEIGYHYEDLSLANGDYEKALILFEAHLQRLRLHADIDTIAMHGRPLSKFNNQDLWSRFNVSDHGLIGEAFLDIDYKNVYYFTDTGRNWNNMHNLRDKTDSLEVGIEIENTDELGKFIVNHSSSMIALITHPERWSGSKTSWFIQWSKDMLVNQLKTVINAYRNSGMIKNGY